MHIQIYRHQSLIRIQRPYIYIYIHKHIDSNCLYAYIDRIYTCICKHIGTNYLYIDRIYMYICKYTGINSTNEYADCSYMCIYKLRFCLRAEKAVEHEGDSDKNDSWCPWNCLRDLKKRLDALEIRGRVVTIQTTVLLKLARIFRSVLEKWGDMLSIKLKWKVTVRVIVKSHKEYNNNSNYNNWTWLAKKGKL